MSSKLKNMTLNDIGKAYEERYSNIRFLFEIDFSEDDYMILKELFQKDVLLQSTYFE